MSYSFIFGYRNKNIVLTEWCIKSLYNYIDNNCELIIVDYGSSYDYQSLIKNLLKKYPKINYIYNETQGWPWNRAHALNTGIKIAKGEYLIIGDIDMIYQPNFVENLYKYKEPSTIYNYRCRYLPQKYSYSNFSFEKANKLKLVKSGSTAQGLIIANKDCFLSANGYDEFFKVWGFEDMELLRKFQTLGFKQKWIDDDNYFVYHQWHPHVLNEQKRWLQPASWFNVMKEYFNDSKELPTDWGKRYNQNDRPALNAFLNKNISNQLELKNSLFYSLFEIYKQIEQSPVGEKFSITYNNPEAKPNSSLQKIKNKINFKKQVQLGISLSDLGHSALFYFSICFHNYLFSDYYFEIKNDSSELIIIK